MKCLVTGGSGFVGQHLVQRLRDLKHEVYIFDVRCGAREDIRDYEQIRRAIETIEPDWIFHLAAQADVPEGLLDPRRAFEVNLTGTLNLLEAVRNTASRARLLLIGSAAEYGNATPAQGKRMITEECPVAPTEPYAVSKLAATTLGMVYAQKYGLSVVVARPFNHTGPGRPSRYVDAAFARRIVAIERGQLDVLWHGDLSAVRNFTDVRDVVRAYPLLIEQSSGIYNVCSDSNVSIKDVLDMLVESATVPIFLKLDPTLGRSTKGEHFWVPSAAKLYMATSWVPQIPLTQTFADLLDWWRAQ